MPLAHYPYKSFMHKHKCVFIHIPKNAGSSVLAAFKDNSGRKHAKWSDFYESNDYFFNRYVKFAIVRNPLDKLISAYNYSLLGGNHSAGDNALKDQIQQNSSCFNEFVDKLLCYDFIMQQVLFYPQYLFVFDRQLTCMVDYMLRYEELSIQWPKLAYAINLPIHLPHKNISVIQTCDVQVSKASLDKIYQLYSLDYQLLEYK